MFDPLLWGYQASEGPVALGEPVAHNDPLDIYRRNLERLSGEKAPIEEAPKEEFYIKKIYESYRNRYLNEIDNQWDELFRLNSYANSIRFMA